MSEDWSPFREADNYLPKYNHLFLRVTVAVAFGDHPQILEDWLYEHCPNNFCYTWLWYSSYKNSAKDSIVSDILGVPEELVMPIKLMTSIDPIDPETIMTKNYYGQYMLYTTSKWQKL